MKCGNGSNASFKSYPGRLRQFCQAKAFMTMLWCWSTWIADVGMGLREEGGLVDDRDLTQLGGGVL